MSLDHRGPRILPHFYEVFLEIITLIHVNMEYGMCNEKIYIPNKHELSKCSKKIHVVKKNVVDHPNSRLSCATSP